MFRFWGARPRLLVPDNLRSGVHKASFYGPEINRSYGAMAAHYGVGVLPALARVGLDYHVEVDGFYYSVPHSLIRAEVDLRIAERTIGIFHRGQRVGVHQRRYGGQRHGTDPDHMPSAHRRYAEWSPERFRRWANSIGPNTQGLVTAVLANRPHPEQGFRTCLGILRLYSGLDTAPPPSGSAPPLHIGALPYPTPR